MATTKDLKTGHFFHFVKVKEDTPVHHRATTREVDEPFRMSESHVIRLWPSKTALVMGKWEDSGLEEDEALRLALWSSGDLAVVDDEGHILADFERDDF